MSAAIRKGVIAISAFALLALLSFVFMRWFDIYVQDVAWLRAIPWMAIWGAIIFFTVVLLVALVRSKPKPKPENRSVTDGY